MARLHSRIYLHFLGVLLAVGLATAGIFAWGARSAFVHELAERAARHAASLAAETLSRPGELERRVVQLHADLELDVAVRDPDGRVLAAAGAPLAPPSGHDLARLRAGEVVIHPRPLWTAAAPVRDGSGALLAVIQTGSPRPPHWTGIGRRLLGVGVALALVALATLPLARRIARPVARLTAAARQLGGGDLGARVPVAASGRGWLRRRHGGELEELAAAFNDMAGRVERLVRGQRALLANVSHELRSPLARLRVALELLPRDGASAARVAGLEADLAELERLVADVLTGARLEATGIGARRDRVDAGALLADLAAQAGRDPLTAGVTVTVDPPPPLQVSADAVLLRRALWNLVENAAKYGAPPILLGARRDGDRVVFRVADAGPGIPASERERVLEPFYRRDAARTPAADGEPPRGFGLGLTLARQIATAHGGDLAIEAATTADGRERGCAVELRLPAA